MEQELTRGTVDPKYTWDVSRIYESDETWEQAIQKAKEQADALAAMAGTMKDGKVDISFAPGNGIEMLTTLGGAIKASMEKGSIHVKGSTPVPFESFLVDASAEASSGRNSKTMPEFVDFTGRWNALFDSEHWSVQTNSPKATLAFSSKYGLPWRITEQSVPLNIVLKKSLLPYFRKDIKLSTEGVSSLDLDKGIMSHKGTAKHELFTLTGDASFTDLFNKPSVAGQARVVSSNVKDASAMFGLDLPVAEGTSAFSTADAQGRYTVSDRNVALSKITGMVDATSVSGNVTFDWKKRLKIEGKLSSPSLDLDSYLPQRNDEEQGEGAKTLLPLAFLKDTDLRLTLLADQLRVFSTPFGQSTCSVTQKDGVLTSPFSMRLPGGGKASGHFTAALSADGKQADIALKALAPQMNMLKLCQQRGQKTLISGTGTADFDLHARQRYWDDWKHTLGGAFAFMVKNGAIISPPSPEVLEKGITESSTTNFHTMAMSATVRDGIISCNDFRILDTMLDVHGSGNVDLGNDSIDAHATITLAGIPEMPVEIKGKLFAPETNYKLLGAVTGTVGNIGSTLIDIVGSVITAPFKLLTGKRVLQP